MVFFIFQWAITLQEVHDERSRGSIISSKKCLCHKASAIGQKLTHLATLLLNQLQQEDASSGNDSTQQLHQDFDLMKIVDDVQSALRAGVSIQVRNFDGFFFTMAWQFDKSCHAQVSMTSVKVSRSQNMKQKIYEI